MKSARVFSLLSYASQIRRASTTIKSAIVDQANRTVLVNVHGRSLKLPFAWLRDNCQCASCLNAPIKARKHLLINFNPHIEAKKVEVHGELAHVEDEKADRDSKLKVHWSDSHTSEYDFRWLKRFSFNESARSRREAEHDVVPERYWDVRTLNELGGVPRFSYEKILKCNDELRKFLSKFIELGLCILHGVPLERGHVSKVCERIAFVRESHYGRTFTVENKVDPSNLAYTSDALGLHTDLPYLFEPPGVQLLHCIRQADDETQGLSLFADGFHCAEVLRKENEEYFRILTETKVDYKDYSTDAVDRFWLLASHPTIELHPNSKRLTSITMNHPMRDVYLNCELDKVQQFYNATHRYNQILSDPKNCVSASVKKGEMTVFLNRRVLHGRTSFRGSRLLEGCYLGLAETKSRLRVLLKNFERKGK